MWIRYSNCRNIHDTGSFIVWDEHCVCMRSKGTMKGTRTEHRRPRVHDTGVTTRLGTNRWYIENNKKWSSLGKRLVLIGTGAGKQIILRSGRDLGTSGLQTMLRTGVFLLRFG